MNNKDPDGTFIIGAIIGGIVGCVSAIKDGKGFLDVLDATFEGAIVGGLCEEGGLLLVLGAAIHGGYTSLTTEGDISEKIFRGTTSFLSTLFWGEFGNFAISGYVGTAEYSLAKNTISILFGIDASITDYVIQHSEIPSWYTNAWNRIFDKKSTEQSTARRPGKRRPRDPDFSQIYNRTEVVLV